MWGRWPSPSRLDPSEWVLSNLLRRRERTLNFGRSGAGEVSRRATYESGNCTARRDPAVTSVRLVVSRCTPGRDQGRCCFVAKAARPAPGNIALLRQLLHAQHPLPPQLDWSQGPRTGLRPSLPANSPILMLPGLLGISLDEPSLRAPVEWKVKRGGGPAFRRRSPRRRAARDATLLRSPRPRPSARRRNLRIPGSPSTPRWPRARSPPSPEGKWQQRSPRTRRLTAERLRHFPAGGTQGAGVERSERETPRFLHVPPAGIEPAHAV